MGDLIRFPVERRNAAKAAALEPAQGQITDSQFDGLASGYAYFGQAVGGIEMSWVSTIPCQFVIPGLRAVEAPKQNEDLNTT